MSTAPQSGEDDSQSSTDLSPPFLPSLIYIGLVERVGWGILLKVPFEQLFAGFPEELGHGDRASAE
jgi:hypothetical protein